jgi:hypothetical protein
VRGERRDGEKENSEHRTLNIELRSEEKNGNRGNSEY